MNLGSSIGNLTITLMMILVFALGIVFTTTGQPIAEAKEPVVLKSWVFGVPETIEIWRMLSEDLEKLGIRILIVDQRDTEDIIKSIITIGQTCGNETKAQEIVSDISARMDRIKEKTQGLSQPKVLICIGRTIGSETLEDVFICGRKGFYNEMITLAGGINAYEGNEIRYPTVTGEGITRLNPEVIIEIIPDLRERGLDEKTVMKDWELLQGVDAVKNRHIFIFGEDYVATPGPRFILTLEQMAKAIHPEEDWE